MDDIRIPIGKGRVCCACGAVERGDVMVSVAVSYARKGDAWFCEECLRDLPAYEVDRRVREVALRGVPLS